MSSKAEWEHSCRAACTYIVGAICALELHKLIGEHCLDIDDVLQSLLRMPQVEFCLGYRGKYCEGLKPSAKGWGMCCKHCDTPAPTDARIVPAK